MRVAPFSTGVELAGPTRSMRLPLMITVLFGATAAGRSRSGWITVAPTIAIVSARHGKAERISAAARAQLIMVCPLGF